MRIALAPRVLLSSDNHGGAWHNNEPIPNRLRMCKSRQNLGAIIRGEHIKRTAAAAAAAQRTVKYPHSRQQARKAGATERWVKR